MSGLPDSRSSESKCAVSLAPMARLAPSYRAPSAPIATMSTAPGSSQRLTIRTTPSGPVSEAAGNNATMCAEGRSWAPAIVARAERAIPISARGKRLIAYWQSTSTSARTRVRPRHLRRRLDPYKRFSGSGFIEPAIWFLETRPSATALSAIADPPRRATVRCSSGDFLTNIP